jgi:hypothetical protein
MNLTDALLTETGARSFVELSLSPRFERRWPSLYQALDQGRIDRDALRATWVAHAPMPTPGHRWVLGLDASAIPRPYAETSRDRTAQLVPNLGSRRAVTRPGWSVSSLVVLPETPSGWTYHLDHRRISSSQTAAEVGAAQLAATLPLLAPRLVPGESVLVCGDRYYSGTPFLKAVAALRADGLPVEGLFRLPRNRTLYRPAPPRTGKPGAPRKDGTPFVLKDPTTHGAPDCSWEGLDEKGRPIRVEGWTALHFKASREAVGTVYRVTRPRALDTQRDPKVSWFLYIGEPPPPEEIPVLYRRRFGQEHGYRFDKGSLLWTAPQVRTPEQFERWTAVMGAAHNQLVLARPLASAIVRPWEPMDRPATPQQVRRAMAKILVGVGTPAGPCRPRGNAPGRPEGFRPAPTPRFPVVRKASPKPSSRSRPPVSPGGRSAPPVPAPPISPLRLPSDALFQAIQAKVRSLQTPSQLV